MINFSCRCGKQFTVNDEHGGEKAKCNACGASITIPFATMPDLADDEVVNEAGPPTASRPAPPKVREYKVLTQKDKWFSGKFDPANLEAAINAYAQQGWTVRSMTTATVPGGFGGSREELIVLLER